MRKFGRLYIDVDQTIIARYFPDTSLELRPGAISQLRVLSKLFDCRWLTCWPWDNPEVWDIQTLLRSVYARDLIDGIRYQKWGVGSPVGQGGGGPCHGAARGLLVAGGRPGQR